MPSLGQLGRYELLSLLGKGGMGEVYLARARGLAGFEKLVVIKRSLPSLSTDREPLFAEARLVATLQHTNIVQVYDVETDGSTVFIAMEFLHGQDARAIVRRSWGAGAGLPLDHALAIALAVCAGLHYAHDKRDADGTLLEIVHRDVSPSNVFVTYDGGVKLIDFGIAKATTLPSETQLGTIKGKPGYMSPEQCRGEPIDRRSDVFSAGILLYEMTTGRRPFRADNEYLLYREICEIDPPLPSTIDPSYPAALEAIVMQALAKDRRDRQPTAHALQEQLAELANVLRLDVSQFGLGRYMARVFDDELDAWRQAQKTGQSLIEHVIRRATASAPAIEPAPTVVPAPSQSLATTAVETKRPLPRRGRRIALAVLVGAAATIAATIAIGSRDDAASGAEPRPQTRQEPASAPPAPSSPASAAGDLARPATEPPRDVPHASEPSAVATPSVPNDTPTAAPTPPGTSGVATPETKAKKRGDRGKSRQPSRPPPTAPPPGPDDPIN